MINVQRINIDVTEIENENLNEHDQSKIESEPVVIEMEDIQDEVQIHVCKS